MAVSPRITTIGTVLVMLEIVAIASIDPDRTGTPHAIEYIAALVWVLVEIVALNAVLRWGQRRHRTVAVTTGIIYVTVALLGAVVTCAVTALADAIPGQPTSERSFYAGAIHGALNGLVILGLWSLTCALPELIRYARDRERERYEQQLAADRIRIKATLEPHFVLNTLNTIAGLVGKHPDRARELIGDLGDLLRDLVRTSDLHCHPASAEIAWLERYARLLEARHPGQLTVRLQLEAAARDVAIPIMLLQPIVENAVHHGALHGGGHVEVDVRIVRDHVRCTVEDDGPGLSSEPVRPGARGVELVRHRLALEAPGGTFELASHAHGARAVILLPVGPR
jgi:signal transduction histidine kinase